MNNEELLKIQAGSSTISSTVLNAVVRAINTLFELGKSLGSTIRRYKDNKLCDY